MAAQTKQDTGLAGGLLSELPVDRLKDEVIELGKALAKRGVSKLGESLSGSGGKLGGLGDVVPGPGDVAKAAVKAASPVGAVKGAAGKVKDAIPGVGSDDSDDSDEGPRGGPGVPGDDTDLKVTNIVETVDVPVTRDVAYQLWTQFEEFPAFMKKVETVRQKDPAVVTWKAQIFWSHRTWTAKIVDQVPPERIVWKSDGDKGWVDGAVTFHELAPDLTRVLVSLEYHPQGLFERTGNLWRAQGRRVRVELKHFRRYVANHAIMKQDDVDGWEGEIHEGKVKRRSSSSAAKKSASGGSTAKKSTSSGGSTARKSTSGGSTAKKSTSSGGSTAKKSTSGGSTAKKSASSGSTAKKTAAKKSTGGSTAKKSTSSGSTAKKTAAKKSTSKRTAAAAKTAPKRTTASAGARKSSSGGRSSRSATRNSARSSGTRSKS